MIKAILLDLDNTLLHNPNMAFAFAYRDALEQYFERQYGIRGMGAALQHAVRSAHKQQNAERSIQDYVLDSLAAALQQPRNILQYHMDTFYHEIYPALRDCTQPVEGAAELVDELRARDNLALIIATNPIYDAEAVRQRLAWAGLPNDFKAYALVTHSGTMHFAKPNPAYYAEILARVGIEPDEALMVGDDPRSDTAPAALAGLHTYLITSADAESSNEHSGSLRQFRQYIRADAWADSFSPGALTAEMIQIELAGNVGALFGMLADVQPHQWEQHPEPEEWSILQVVCHLAESEHSVQRPRLLRILQEDNPFLTSPKPPPGPREMHCSEAGYSVAQHFAAERRITRDLLQSLPPEAWQRPARHSIFGPTTLLEMAHFTAQHDRLHLTQLCRTLGKCT